MTPRYVRSKYSEEAVYFDAHGDPRDIEAEAREILSGDLPLRPTTAHCLAVLRDVLNKEEKA